MNSPLIVAVGGDGIVHEVASGLRGSTIPLGQIPFGSGNDCCITHGISRDNLNQAIDVLVNGLIEVVELGDSRDLRHQRWTAIQVLHQITGMVRPATRAEQYVGSSLNPMLESLQKLVEQSFVVRNGSRGRKKYTYLGVTTIPFWPRRKIELKLDDGEPSIHDLTMMTVTTGETFGGDIEWSQACIQPEKMARLS